MTLAERGQRAHIARQKAAAGISLSYRRGAESATVTGWRGKTAFSRTAPEPGGASLIWGDIDFFIAVEDLVLNGTQTKPQEGDRIAIDAGTASEKVYEIQPTATGEPAFRYSDPTELLWRIHAKRENG